MTESKREKHPILAGEARRGIISTRTTELLRTVQGYEAALFLDKGARDISYLLGRVSEGLGMALPPRRFANIGAEKDEVLEFYCREHGLAYPDTIAERKDAMRRVLSNRQALVDVYGEENIAQLEKIFTATPAKKWLVVDEKEASGITQAIAKQILSVIFPEAEFDFFIFAPSPTDGDSDKTKKLYSSVGDIFWDEKSGALVSDDPDEEYDPERNKAFRTVRAFNPTSISRAKRFRGELRALAQQIIKQK